MRPCGFTHAVLLGVLLGIPARSQGGPINYIEFTEIASFPSGGFVSPPAINESGMVAFTISPDGPLGIGVFSGSGGPLTTIALSSTDFRPVSRPAINDAGTVSFQAALGERGSTILAGSGGPLTTIAESGPFSFVGTYTSINNEGTVAFSRLTATDSGIFTGSGGPIATIADISGPFRDFPDADPAINNEGLVAFFATLDEGSSGIFTRRSGPVTTIVDTSGAFNGFLTHPSVNDAGMVAFMAALAAGGNGIFTGDGSTITRIADTGGPFGAFLFASINSAGIVAFQGFLDTGGEGIFTGPDPDADKVIGIDDELFGFSVRSLLFGPHGINDIGQIAFLAGLASGRTVVVRADPAVTIIPEPSTVNLLALGTLGLIWYGQRRRNRGCDL
jgi:hypothetical protein